MNRGIAINLFRPTSRFSDQERALFRKLRIYSAIVLFFIIALSAFVAIAYLAGATQYSRLEEERAFLAKSVSAQAKKEILLLSFQERVPVVQQIMKNQQPLDNLLGSLAEIASPLSIQTVSFNKEHNYQVQTTITTDSLEEMQEIIGRVLQKTEERDIHSPYIQSLSIGGNGKVEAILRFAPIL